MGFLAAEDYLPGLLELDAIFSTEAAYREYLLRIRWPEGFICPRRGERKAWLATEVLWECADCGRQVSAAAGTIFQDIRLPFWLLVPRGVVGNQSEEWCQRQGPPPQRLRPVAGDPGFHPSDEDLSLGTPACGACWV